jgi:flagellar biogenesis protein FliO
MRSPSFSALKAWLRQWWSLSQSRANRRQLRIRETLGLGERRFVAVVEYEDERFLIGGTSTALTMLARLDDKRGGTAGRLGIDRGEFSAPCERVS